MTRPSSPRRCWRSATRRTDGRREITVKAHKGETITAARNLATRQASGATGWAPQLRELLAFAKISRIFGLDVALANLAGVAPAEDRDVVADTLAKTFGKTVRPLALGRQI